MKKVIATTMAAFLVAQVASAVSTTVDFASAYIFRGVTANEGLLFSLAWKVKLLALLQVAGLTLTSLIQLKQMIQLYLK